MKLRLIISLCSLITITVLGFEFCKSNRNKAPENKENSYTGNMSCRVCHSTEHEQWTTSHHFKSMQPANDSTVLGNFNNASLSTDGVITRFFKADGKFIINTEGDDGKLYDFEVKYVFGFTPLQQYLVEFPGGRMQASRASWDTKQQKWFHQNAGQKIPAGDWLHWTGNAQNWNTMCASCHSTNVKKGYNSESDTYHTTFNDDNVSCESCHGPGKNHIEYIEEEDYKAGKKITGSLLKLYKGSGQMAEINICAYCHARREEITGSGLPGDEMLNDFIPDIPTTDFYYADGQINDEDYNLTPFMQSKMFNRGIRCTNCHNPHSGKLKIIGAAVCGQCHDQTKYNDINHTMHPAKTAEVSCISCHMPSKIYMGNDLRHDHSFRIPRPDLTVKYGVPNTCNSCHKNKSAGWAADKISANFGDIRKYHFSEDLIPGSLLDNTSEGHLYKLLGDTATPVVIRAAAIYYLSRLQNEVSVTAIVNYLKDSNSLVRYTALKSLATYSPDKWKDAVAPLLYDPVKAVRIGAANLFINLSPSQIKPAFTEAFSKVKDELYKYIMFQTDFAQGSAMAGEYFHKQNDLAMAKKYYLMALAKDSQLAGVRLNLAVILNVDGENQEALQQLLIASKLEPKNDQVFFSLGLLYAELKQFDRAGESLKKAFTINRNNVKAQYNYGILLQQRNKTADAEKVYKQALQADPASAEVLNALLILYLQTNQIAKAKATGKLLQQYHSGDPQYLPLLRQIGIN